MRTVFEAVLLIGVALFVVYGFSNNTAKSARLPNQTITAKNSIDTETMKYTHAMHLSRAKIYEKLSDEGYADEEIEQALQDSNVDFRRVATRQAKKYSCHGYTDQQIFDKLTGKYGDMFTVSEANYALQHYKAAM